VSEAQLFTAYTNLGRRTQFTVGAYQEPYYFLSDERLTPVPGTATGVIQEQDITRYIIRQAFAVGLYPLNRFSRFEFGARFNNIDRSTMTISRAIDTRGFALSEFDISNQRNSSGLNYIAPYAAYVSDNALWGYTGPIMGRRFRFQVEPSLGSFTWVDYLADYRRYDPILFNFITVATRAMTSITVGKDEGQFPKYIGNPSFIRGYDRENFYGFSCATPGVTVDNNACGAKQLLGSRAALINAEVRFPLVRRFDLGLLPISLPPLDGLVFYDAGIAWTPGQELSFSRPDDYDLNQQRYVLRSYGLGLRLNLFGFAIVRWDYAKPLDRPGRKPFWTWSLGPSF
jgi:outer membrane protein assembly factor BamA